MANILISFPIEFAFAFGYIVYGNNLGIVTENTMFLVVIIAQLVMFVIKMQIKYMAQSLTNKIVSVVNLMLPIQFLEDWIIQLSIINVTPFSTGYFILISVIFVLEIFRDVDGYKIAWHWMKTRY